MNLGASQVRRRLKGFGHGVRRIQSAEKNRAVIIEPGNPAKGKPATYATAHDLRRSAAQRLLDSGVPPQGIQMVLRHASFTTTRKCYAPSDVQKAAATLRKHLLSLAYLMNQFEWTCVS